MRPWILRSAFPLAVLTTLILFIFLFTALVKVQEKLRCMQNIVMFAYMGAAGVSALISAVPMFFYKIDFKFKEQMRRYNAEQETD